MTVDEQLHLSLTSRIAVRYLSSLTSRQRDTIVTSLEVIFLSLYGMKLICFIDVFMTSSEVIFVNQNVLKLRAS